MESNSRKAGEKVREFTDYHLDNSGKVFLNEYAPLTAIFSLRTMLFVIIITIWLESKRRLSYDIS